MNITAINAYFCQAPNKSIVLYGSVTYKRGEETQRVELIPDEKGSYWADPVSGETIRIGTATPLTAAAFLESARQGKEAGNQGERFGEETVELADSTKRILRFRAVWSEEHGYRVLGNVRTLPKGYSRWNP